MADAFISYRRKPSASLAHLLQKGLQAQDHFDIYLDTTRTDSAKVHFPDRLLGAIDTSKVFICLLADTTLESVWVLREIERAYQQQKPCIPVFQESYKPMAIENPAVDYLLSFDGVHMMDERGLYMDEAVQQIAEIVKKTTTQRRTRKGLYLGALVPLILALVAVIFILTRPANEPPPASGTPDTAAQAQTDSPTNAVAVTEETTPTNEPTATATPTDAPTFTLTPTNEPTVTSTPTGAPSSTSTDQSTLTHTASPTITPTDETTLSAEQITLTPVTHNADWTPIERDFDGVTMVLVPPGCFMMGSEDGDENEKPVNPQCFQQPFWLDRYEVTTAQFVRYGGEAQGNSNGADNNQPRENVTWFEARDFCEKREGRLPTEAEWEYAARGPDNLVYSWGNNFEDNSVVFPMNSGGVTADIGSKPAGDSWVGASDMIGNVWEWVNSVYRAYPYDPNDGREDKSNTSDLRVLRGGSFQDYVLGDFRAANRGKEYPGRGGWRDTAIFIDYGFRCARDYGSETTQNSTDTSPTETSESSDVEAQTMAPSGAAQSWSPGQCVIITASTYARRGPGVDNIYVQDGLNPSQGRLFSIVEGPELGKICNDASQCNTAQLGYWWRLRNDEYQSSGYGDPIWVWQNRLASCN